MKKIKTFISKNKDELKVLTYGTMMMSVGFYIGRKYEGVQLNDVLDNLARTGKTISNEVDGKNYVLSIIEKI